MSRSWVWISCLLPLVSLACGPKGETTLEAKSTAPKPVPIRVAPITRRSVERTVEVVGSLKGLEEVTIGAKRTGRIAKIHHDMGDRVKPGTLLVELETVDTDLAIDQAQRRLDADLAKLGLKALPKGSFDMSNVPSVVQSRVALERSKLNLGRERALMAKGAGTTQDFQNADNDEKGAQAAYDNAVLTAESTLAGAMASKVSLDVARQGRIDLMILAPQLSKPVSGLSAGPTFAITRRAVSEGQMVKEGEALFDLVIENPLRIWCNVPERYSGMVALGQDARIHVTSHPTVVFKGKVSKINPSVDPVSRTFQVEATLPNDEGKLRPGGFAKVSIVTNHRDETNTVPRQAVAKLAGVTKIFLISSDNKSHSLLVETATEGDGWVEVVGQVPDGAQVAVEGTNQLADDSPIVIKPPVEDDTPKTKKAEPAPVSAKPAEKK